MSGSKAVVVEVNECSLYVEITHSQGLRMPTCNQRMGDRVEQSVRRRPDFDFMIETEMSNEDERNDDIP